MTSPSFPAALDALANPGPTTETDDAGYELDIVVARLQNCIMAIENKLGIGAGGPPGTSAVLRRSATGASQWGQVAVGDIVPASFPTLIQTTNVLVANLPAATFSSIPQTYKSLMITLYAISTAAGIGDAAKLTLNGVTTGYYNQYVLGSGATAASAEALGGASIDLGTVPAGTPVGWMGTTTAWIHGYSVASGYKSVLSTSYFIYGVGTSNQQIQVKGGIATPGTAGITSLSVLPGTGQWGPGSIISLYGWP